MAATPKSAGDRAEALALEHLQRHGLALVCRNYRVARGPRARGGEIDLILRERDGTVVFVEVRSRADVAFGGALASVTARKQQRLVLAAPPLPGRPGAAAAVPLRRGGDRRRRPCSGCAAPSSA